MDIVSACLIGCNCRYDGENEKRDDPRFANCVPLCPEVFSELGVPRDPAEIKNGKVITNKGKDVTREFERGARVATQLALTCGAKRAFLKEKSPSCGVAKIYDGSFARKLVRGEGVFTQMLKKTM